MSKVRRRVFSLVISVVALGLFFLIYRTFFASKADEGPRFEVRKVDRGDIVAKITASGTVSPLVSVQVGSQVSGRIQHLYVDFNTKVTKGQLIATLDPQLFRASLEQARANTTAARAALTRANVQARDAQRQLVRAKSLADRKLIAVTDLEAAESAVEVANAQVQAASGQWEQARAALHQAEVNLAYTRIVSPIDGMVISRNVDVGQTVAASLQAPTLFVIAEDLAQMQVNTSVAEADVGKLEGGMHATFTVDAYPSETFEGVVRQIRNAPQTVQNVVTYDAVIDVQNPELKLKPGMTANVTFIYAKREDVLRVPNVALRFRPGPEILSAMSKSNAPTDISPKSKATRAPAGLGKNGGPAPAGSKSVWMLRDGMLSSLSIKTGVSDGVFTELVAGDLAEEQELVIEATLAMPGRSMLPGQGMGGGMRRMF